MDRFYRSDAPSHIAFPVASAGYPLIFAAAFTTAVFALLGLTIPALIGLAATFFICYFFRDPDRVIPSQTGAVVSPADGKIISAGAVDNSPFFNRDCIKISIFMSVFNVHVNRVPHEGRIKKVNYNPGKFFSANLDKASHDNEQNAVLLETEDGRDICMVQVAGLIARRIICKIQAGDIVARGQRFGLICFGSRLDVYLPPDTDLKVTVGDRVNAGTSVLGDLS
ncbi:MAG: phosphatidylserine decarboxylase family protein [Deltaproteobacteria bacterium]|nr:phosphatidylserine decarboxylase family protein [Deltaproteobacteria bacterium]MBW2192223.1 phosphatidylserine decarboxylase family protein [Deltaproteobacteria bacterium]